MIDIYQNIKNDEYENKLQYPKNISRKCECGNLLSKNDKYCSKCGLKSDYDNKLKLYQVEKLKYNNEDDIIYNQFKKDLIEYFEWGNYKSKLKLFDIAWQNGHSNGYWDVINSAAHINNIIKLINDDKG